MTDDPAAAWAAVEAALRSRTDLDVYDRPERRNKLLMFAAQLMLGFDDVHDVAASALTDGPDDKACDLIYVDRDAGLLVLAQAYEAQTGRGRGAPAGKVNTLLQAINWLFTADPEQIPARIASAVAEARAALDDGQIDQVRIWYVHNLPGSDPVRRELAAIETHAGVVVQARYQSAQVDVQALEIGRETLADVYAGTLNTIAVAEQIPIACSGNFLKQEGPGWTGYVVTVGIGWLSGLWYTHGDKLFSANIRGYLGLTKNKQNINAGIRHSLLSEPGNFCVYNNGITAIAHSVKETEDGDLDLTGFAIVNGAQTTGAVSNAGDNAEEARERAEVMLRVIVAKDPAVVQGIVRNNNRQNQTLASDFRSNDRVQRRLTAEFAALGVSGYTGGRRGDIQDTIQRSADHDVNAVSAARALVAFHGDPGTAYHDPNLIWESNETYQAHFHDRTTARHVLFCWSLVKAIEQWKQELRVKPDSELTGPKRALRDFLEQRGAHYLLAAAMGGCVEVVLDRPVPNTYRLSFGDESNPKTCIRHWRALLELLLPNLHKTLVKALVGKGLRNADGVSDALDRATNIVQGDSGELTRREACGKFREVVRTTDAPPARAPGHDGTMALIRPDAPPVPDQPSPARLDAYGEDFLISLLSPGRPACRLLILSDARAVAWVLREQRAAFPAEMRDDPPWLGDELLIYLTRGTRRHGGRVVARARVTSPTETLEMPVEISGRRFTTGCTLRIEALTAPWDGVPLADLRHDLAIFPRPDYYGAYLRHTLIELPDQDAELLRTRLAPVAGSRREHLTEYEDIARE